MTAMPADNASKTISKIIEIEIFNVSTFLERAKEILPGFGSYVWWFRGHASSDWKLVPAAQRNYDAHGETLLLTRFMLGAPMRHIRVPMDHQVPDWLSLMQHYGLPTRLLDWTASPLTALYFALAHEATQYEGPCVLWALAPTFLGRNFRLDVDKVCILDGVEAKHLIVAAFRAGARIDDVYSVVGKDIDWRLAVQQGAFTIHGSPTPLERLVKLPNILFKFVIPSSAKANFAEELWSLGLRRSGLFPDLENLARDLATDERLVPRRPQL